MNRIALAFVAGLALGLWLMSWHAWGGTVSTTTGDCQISVHLRSDPPGLFRC